MPTSLYIIAIAIIAKTLGEPNGYYHQEYNYKAHSASFVNNELKQKNDAGGYYTKTGDLEGRTKPKINGDSFQTEYVNPKFLSSSDNNENTDGHFDDVSSSRASEVEHLQSLYANSNNHNGRMYPASESVYASSDSTDLSSSEYAQKQRMQRVLLAQMQNAIDEQYRKAPQFGATVTDRNRRAENDIYELEMELKRNISRELDQNSHRYTYSNSRSPSGHEIHNNYRLRNQLESYLGRELEERVRHKYSRGRSSPSGRIIDSKFDEYPQRDLTLTASRIQNNLDGNLNRKLDQLASSNSGTYGVYSHREQAALLEEIRRNVTREFNRELDYPHQSGSNINQDIEAQLKRQVEEHLTAKLNREWQRLQTTRNHHQQEPLHSGSSSSSSSSGFNEHVARLQQQLQRQLSAQLQEALRVNLQNQQRRPQAAATTNGGNYQQQQQEEYSAMLNRLRGELDRNITDCVQENSQAYKSGAYMNGYRGGVTSQNLEELKDQLQSTLQDQLQQGLQKSWSSYSQWSSSSSWHYEPEGANVGSAQLRRRGLYH